MSNIIVRVQLHREDNYLQLHAAMSSRGFSRTLPLDSGRSVHLPQGTYYYSRGDLTAAVAAAQAAATECSSPVKIVAADGPIRVSGLDYVT